MLKVNCARWNQSKELLREEPLHQNQLLIYIDETHIHLDTDKGYGWSIKGERFWVSSSSPGRKKVSFYGVYLYNQAQTRIFLLFPSVYFGAK